MKSSLVIFFVRDLYPIFFVRGLLLLGSFHARPFSGIFYQSNFVNYSNFDGKVGIVGIVGNVGKVGIVGKVGKVDIVGNVNYSMFVKMAEGGATPDN